MSEASKTPETDAIVSGLQAMLMREGHHLSFPERFSQVQATLVQHSNSLELRLTEALDRALRAEIERDNARAQALADRAYQSVNREQSSKIAELEKDATRLDWWGGDIRNAIDKAMAEGKPARAILASSGQGAKGIAKDSGSSDPAS